MRGVRNAVFVGLLLLFCLSVVAPSAKAEGVSLLQAIETVEKEMKLRVVKAATAGSYHHITAIGDGKTKVIKVSTETGKPEVTEERDWKDAAKEICEKAKVDCSKLAANAVTECEGELRSVKAKAEEGAVKYIVCLKTKKGFVNATVCGCTGRVGAVESAEAPAEACE